MKFDNLGIFLSFISYPFHRDGKDMYEKIFDPFFSKHKEQIAKYDPNAEEGKDPYPNVYKPEGYRMFGTSGLAILSLVDDYSFYNRFFNKNHIQSLLCPETKDEPSPNLDFKSVVISGVTVHENSDKDILAKAKSTFLLENNPYRYIGIIRLKIDYRILIGFDYAIETVQKIKKRIEELFDDCRRNNEAISRCDYFIMDCYDNDELSVIAFSDRMLPLFNFLGNIRSIKTTDIQQPYKVNETEYEKHVFGLTYLCFGYNIRCGIGDDIEENKIICTIETKPGHRDVFYDYLCGEPIINTLGIIDKSVIISGGCNVLFRMPLKKISNLEDLCKKEESIFRRDARRIKVSLEDFFPSDNRVLSNISEAHLFAGSSENLSIGREYISDVKSLMKKVGISKMVRERMLALFEMYNLSCQNALQNFYLSELKPVLEAFKTMITDMHSTHIHIETMECVLNTEITNMENACYDRLHIQKSNQTPLEYSGGIQQYLTSFDFAYKQIYRTFSPNDRDASYVTISGAERASSMRTLFNLNINDIIYPELFIVLLWKEIANFALKTMNNYKVHKNTKRHINTLNTWNEFLENEDSFRILQNKIHQSDKLLHDDDVSRHIRAMVSDMNLELIKYYIKDYFVFRFAFNGDFDQFWYYYLKILLQSTNSYSRLNQINRKYLIFMLLRIFMVAKVADKREKEAGLMDFLNEKSDVPFDYLLSGDWIECYAKVQESTDEIYKVLEVYGFQQVITYMIESCEENIIEQEFPGLKVDLTDALPDNALKERDWLITNICDELYDGNLVKATNKDRKFTFLISLFSGYLSAVYALDHRQGLDNCLIKSVPRNRKGELMLDKNSNDTYKNMIQIPVDSTGGFFIPAYSTRKDYFRLRTALYRSLWNYRFMFGEKK